MSRRVWVRASIVHVDIVRSAGLSFYFRLISIVSHATSIQRNGPDCKWIDPSIEFCWLGATSVENQFRRPENMGRQNGHGHMCSLYTS